jgi:hypothetical protein
MRRLALGFFAACLAAAVSACSSGGTAFSGNDPSGAKIQSVVLSSPAGGNFHLANIQGSYLEVSAVATTGSAITATIVPDQTFQWTASYAGPTYSYLPSVNGGNLTACPAAPTGPYAGNALFSSPPTTIGSGANGAPLSGGGTAYVPGTSPTTNTIYVAPIVNPQINATGSVTAYCLLLKATDVNQSGTFGTQVIYISS